MTRRGSSLEVFLRSRRPRLGTVIPPQRHWTTVAPPLHHFRETTFSVGLLEARLGAPTTFFGPVESSWLGKPSLPTMRTRLPFNSWVDFRDEWLPEEACKTLHERLLATVPFEQHSVSLFGRVVPQPRLIGWCGTTSYRYSGLTLPPRAVPECLTSVIGLVADAAGVDFNHLLLNLYRDGQDSMGMHADDEAELGRDPTVATLTLGATRKFLLRSRKGAYRADYALGNGSLLIMGGQCQTEYVHGIPKTRQGVGSRLSITFRHVEKR